MAEGKRYYYLKLEEDYFTNKVQKALRRLPSGAEMCLCYLKMQLLGLRTNGVLVYDGIYETFEQEIAEEISEDENIVMMTLAMLRKWNMVVNEAENQIYMSEMQDRFGTTTDVAIRVAKHREKQKVLHCNTPVTNSNVIKDIELDIELDKEKELNTLSEPDVSDDVHSCKEDVIPYKEIIAYLNELAKTQYRYTSKSTKDKIKARYNDGFTIDDFKTAISKKVSEWKNTDMEKYLRPETLFGNKFESYLNQPEKISNSNEKTLPSWYEDQQLEQPEIQDLNEEELAKKLEKLKG